MKNIITSFIGIMLLTGCDVVVNSPISGNSVSDNSSSQAPAKSSPLVSNSPEADTPSEPSIQRYLYTLAGGVIFINPLDSDTGSVMAPVVGTWTVRPKNSQDFYHFEISLDGAYLYAFDRNNNKMYQYQIADNVPFSEYSTNIPLSALNPPTINVGVQRDLFNFGTDGNMYMLNYLTTTSDSMVRVDQYKVTQTGKLSLTKTAYRNAINDDSSKNGVTFTRHFEVSQDIHTYRVDTSANRIVHAVDGVDQESTRIGAGTNQIVTLGLH